MKQLFTAVALLFVVGAAGVAAADTTQYPILSVERLTLGARLEHAWYSGSQDGPVLFLTHDIQKEFGVGVVGAYALTAGEYPTALIGGTVYALDSKWFRSYVGLNVRLFAGGGVK